MPARRHLNPWDIHNLRPYVMIVDNVDDRLRWRLVGTAVAREAGRDLTDSNVGFYDSTPEAAAGARAIYERVCTTAHPIYATGEFKVKSRAILTMTLLTLRRSDTGANV